VVGERVRIGEGVRFGAYVVLHDDVVVGDGCTIGDHAILGKVSLRGGDDATHEPLVLEVGVSIGAAAILFTGAHVGAGTILGDGAFVREGARIGRDCVLGRSVAIGSDVVLGDRVRMQMNVGLVSRSVVEGDVFIGPNVITTDDDTIGRRPPGVQRRPCILRRGCRIGAAAILLPGVEVGEEAFVGAGSLVRRSVPARTLVVGAPARHVRDLVGP
jgi:acetyltransferase-like isoleucine patch superfamily enzyme